MKHPLGLDEYAHRVFMVHAGAGGGSVYDDPADAIAEAEELAESEGQPWYVTALMAADDCDVHIARPKKKRRALHKSEEPKP